MITKYLQSSGGDWSDPNLMWSWFGTQMDGTGLSDHIEVLVEPGGVFGNKTTQYSMDLEFAHRMNQWNITIKTNPSGISNPATIKGYFRNAHGAWGDSNIGRMIFQNLKLSYNATNKPWHNDLERTRVRLENCLIYGQGSTGCGVLDAANVPAFSNCGLRYCSVFYSSVTTGIGITFYAHGEIRNTLLCVYNVSAVNIGYVLIPHSGVVLYNYGGGGFTFGGPGTLAPDTIQNIDPLLTNQIIQSFDEDSDTMLARNAYQTAASTTTLIDTGDASYPISIDLIGTSRPQGADYDRGAYEYIPVTPTRAGQGNLISSISDIDGIGFINLFRLRAGDPIRDSDKAVDWNADEHEQLREGIGVDGDKDTAVGGQLQTLALDATVSKEATAAKDATVSKEATAAKDATVAKDVTVAKEATLSTVEGKVDGVQSSLDNATYGLEAIKNAIDIISTETDPYAIADAIWTALLEYKDTDGLIKREKAWVMMQAAFSVLKQRMSNLT